MKQILFGMALALSLTAAAVAQDAGQKKSSGDLFLRSGDPATAGTTGTSAYVNTGPINMTGSAPAPTGRDQAAEAAAAQVYNPAARNPAATANTSAQDFSAANYNRSQAGAQEQYEQQYGVTSGSGRSGPIKSPFPAGYGTYRAPTLDALRASNAAKNDFYKRQDAAAQAAQQQPQQAAKRTTAFGTTSELKARQQQQ